MSDETKIIQKAALGSDTTQIGEQNNYYGMTAEEASNLAIKLFMDNFPRLQEEAKKIAKERAEELCKNIVDKLTPVYNFINGRLADKPTVLKPLS